MADTATPVPSSSSIQEESPGFPTTNAIPSSQDPSSKIPSNAPITFRSPLKYNSTHPFSITFTPPPAEWLVRTWTVTHSTLPMWRKAKNVRIGYKLLPPTTPNGPVLYEDEVCSEPTERTFLPQPKSIKGVCTPAGEAAWDWRGKGWLRIATSHWEVLGWGERNGEAWAVTWFAPSLFTPAGLDIYCSERGGISEGLYGAIISGLEALEAADLVDLVKSDMKEVKIDDA